MDGMRCGAKPGTNCELEQPVQCAEPDRADGGPDGGPDDGPDADGGPDGGPDDGPDADGGPDGGPDDGPDGADDGPDGAVQIHLGEMPDRL